MIGTRLASLLTTSVVVVSATTLLHNGRTREQNGRSLHKEENDLSSGRVLSILDFGAVADAHVEGSSENYVFAEFHEEPPSSVSVPWWDRKYDDGDVDPQKNVTSITLTNTAALNKALASAQPGDTVLVPEGYSFAMTGGVYASNLDSVTVDIAGTLHFVHNQDVWPRFPSKHEGGSGNHYGFKPCLHFSDCSNLILTCSSSSRPVVEVNWKKNQVFMNQDSGSAGIINGNGKLWWDEAIMGRLPYKDPDYRPRLLLIEGSIDSVVERLTLVNSPFWTMTIEGLRLEVAHVRVLVDRKYQTGALASAPSATATTATSRRDLLSSLRGGSWFPNDIPDWVGRRIHQPEDLNTDGIDPRGIDIHVHNCIVQNADDSVAVKPPVYGKYTTAMNGTIPVPCTRNVTIEDTVLTGFGASIGSVGPSTSHLCVDQVLFRNISMPGTGKGIYIKSNKSQCRKGETAQISNIVYKDVYMKQPFWWAVWIGPQQQHEPNTALGGDCPLAYPLPGSTRCPTQGCANFENITLQNIFIEDPFVSPGVILGNETNPMKNMVLENITVTSSTWKPWHGKWPFHEGSYPFRGRFKCQHVEGTCKDCFPAPHCLDLI